MSDNTNTTNSAEVILEIQDLCKSFGDHEVLKGISTTIRKGDVLALIGPSGCGKSTFLRSLNLLEIPTSGHVLFEGTDMTDKSVDINHVREKIGMVFQQFNLFPNMTIKENIMLAPVKLNKMTREEAEKKAMELLKRIGLSDKADAYPSQLSGGQKQRVAFARALAPNPNLLLLDEPFAAIDAKVRQELRSWLKDMIERLGVTSIFVTHDQSEAIEVADEIIITNKGRIEQIGSPIDIYQHPQTAFSASFFGQTTTLDDYTKFKTFDVVDNVDRAVIRPEFVKVTKLSETTAQKASVSVGEVIKTSFRGDNIEIAVKCDGGTVYAYRGLDETPITVGEKVNVFLYRLFITKGDEVQILRNKSLQEESVII